MESLTFDEIQNKIKHLEKGIFLCLLRSGSGLCVNRRKRVQELRTELNLRKEIARNF